MADATPKTYNNTSRSVNFSSALGTMKSIIQSVIPKKKTEVKTPTKTYSNEVISITPKKYIDIIKKASQVYNVPASILSSLLHNESTFNPKAKNINKREKSYGIAQINTAVHKVSRKQAEDPVFAINWAAKRLGEMIQKYGVFNGVQAYNTPGAIGTTQLITYANKILKGAENIITEIKPKEVSKTFIPYNNLTSTVKSTNVNSKISQLGNKTTEFGEPTKYESFHPGIDVANVKGTPIPAFTSGVVAKINTGAKTGDNGFGNQVEIKDNQGNTHQYNHLQNINTRVGQQVKEGQQVATMGNTGSVYSPSKKGDGTHLDYRIVDTYNKYINPYTHFEKITS